MIHVAMLSSLSRYNTFGVVALREMFGSLNGARRLTGSEFIQKLGKRSNEQQPNTVHAYR
jgi:hypothetical protein